MTHPGEEIAAGLPGQRHRLGPDEDLDRTSGGEAVRRGGKREGPAEEGEGHRAVRDGKDLGRQGVDPADELGHKGVLGPQIELLRRPDLDDPPFVHHGDLVGDRHRLLLVVGDVDRRDRQGLLEAADLAAHVDAELGVEVGEGLVEQEHPGLDDDRPGEGDPLLLAAGELVGKLPLVGGQADQFEDLGHLPVDIRRGFPLDLEAVGHVLEDD